MCICMIIEHEKVVVVRYLYVAREGKVKISSLSTFNSLIGHGLQVVGNFFDQLVRNEIISKQYVPILHLTILCKNSEQIFNYIYIYL